MVQPGTSLPTTAALPPLHASAYILAGRSGWSYSCWVLTETKSLKSSERRWLSGLANRAGPRWAAMSASMPSMRERNGAASPASAVRQSTLGPDGALARPV